jgi:hypothetical protein
VTCKPFLQGLRYLLAASPDELNEAPIVSTALFFELGLKEMGRELSFHSREHRLRRKDNAEQTQAEPLITH